MRQKTDTFLSGVAKSMKFPHIRLVIKRNLSAQVPQLRKRLRRKEKKELIEKLKIDNDAQEVLFRFSGEKKISTIVTAPQINKFSDQLTNIYRLYCFKDKADQKKLQNIIPTQANPKSKSTQKLKEKKLKNKQRRNKRNELAKIKKREIQRQKTFQLKKQNKIND